MSRYLLLKGFNSYLNRVIKRYETAEEYQDAAEYSQYRDNMNFNPYDGVSAEVVVNYRAGEAMLTPDYIVVLNDTNQITGRYFVQEAVRQRNGQYRILLRRDLIADFKDTILDAPAFIEKATVNKISPFIFNSENMTYNQIKTENEILLKDETQVPWIVGYIAAPQPDEEDRTITATYDHDIDIRTNRTIEQFIADKNPGVIYKGSDWHYAVRVEGGTLGTVGGYEYSWYCNNTVSTAYIIPHQQYYRENGSTSSMRSSTLATFRTQGVATLTANGLGAMLNKNITTVENEESIWNLQGKIVKCGDILYALSVNKIRRNFTVNVSASVSQPIYAAMQSVCSSFKRGSQSTAPSSYKLVGSADEIQILYRELSDKRLTVQTSFGANRKVLNDAPYCMFAMPAETINWKAPDAVERTMDKTVSFALATAIAEQLTQSKCYDLQLLPYCPRQDLINGGKIDLSNSDLVHGADYLFIFPGDQFTAPSGFILFASKSAGTINIPINIAVPEDDVDFKIEDETTFYRLCSPNYAGQFEFKATRNYGVDFVNIDYAYKPFTPYIHANINFKGLYGADTDDTRGLICSGDFSLPQTSDKWAEYEINNKNYLTSFNRQIDHMDTMHKYDTAENIIGAIAGTVGGAVAGGAMGGGVGAVAGGVISGAAGIADVVINEKKYEKTIDYTKDQFNFELGNVQARPDTLAKVSAYNPNNKVFLFIEKYSCTESEKEALRQKLYYNGMSVGVIDRIVNYIQDEPSYIKAKIIRLSTGEDAHINAEIQNEMNMGVFI